MRGNHDCFDLPSWKSRVNYYRTHGQSAGLVEQGRGVYSWQVNRPMGDYQFVAIDACPKRGPSRPLNFFGYLTSKTMDHLERALTYKPFNHTFVVSDIIMAQNAYRKCIDVIMFQVFTLPYLNYGVWCF